MTEKDNPQFAPRERIDARLDALGEDCLNRHWHKHFHTVQDAIACIREQHAALKEITDAFEGRCGEWENPEFNECYNEARAVLAKWRIEL